MTFSANDDHLAADGWSGHHDFSDSITGYQLIRLARFDHKDVSVFAGKVKLSIGGNR
jgi:hypothetical protein